MANDSGLGGVAYPTVSACFAVASYTNNGLNLPNLTLAEQWNRTGTSTKAATGGPVAPGAVPQACIRARMPGSLPISGRIPAVAWSGSGPAASLAGPTHRRQPAVSGAELGNAHRSRDRGGPLRTGH